MRIIRACVDTLEHTFAGDLTEEMASHLDALKVLAQTHECPEPITLGGQEFFVSEQGVRRYRWLVRNEHFVLMLRAGGAGATMVAKISAWGLAEKGVEALWEELLAVTEGLGLTPLNLSRLDLAVDFQGWSPTFEEMRNVRSRSTYRPVIPNVDNPETFYFGKDPKMLRVYNKTVQIQAKGKLWWQTVWRSTGLWDETSDVWRAELELRSEVLKELSCRSMAVALPRLASVYSWGLSETSLGCPNDDSNRARWPEDERWTMLRESFGMPEPLSRVRPFSKLLDHGKASARYVGVMTSLGASLGISDYDELARILYDGGLGYLDLQGKDFADAVEVKRRRAAE